jgi:hypothetical protein
MANVNANDFQETGYWGRDSKIKILAKHKHLAMLNLSWEFFIFIYTGNDCVTYAKCLCLLWYKKMLTVNAVISGLQIQLQRHSYPGGKFLKLVSFFSLNK